MKQVIIAGILGLATACLWAAEAKEEINKAAKQLAGKANYSWVQTVKSEGGGQFNMGPTEGKINKEGVAFVVSRFGEDRTFESAMKGEKRAVKWQDGWQAVPEQGQGGGGRGGFMRRFANPAAQAEELASQTKDLKKTGEGIYAGTLTEEAVKQYVGFGGRGGQNAPTVTGAKGTAKFWVKDGVLSKFEYHVQGTVTRNDQEREVNRTTTVEIKNVGTTKVELPAEAQEVLK